MEKTETPLLKNADKLTQVPQRTDTCMVTGDLTDC